MSTSKQKKLPKYIRCANAALGAIAAQPKQTWRLTQRELGEALNMSQPELSMSLKLLEEKRRIIRGAPLKTRGRNNELIAVNTNPLDMEAAMVRMSSPPTHAPMRGVVDLTTLSKEQIAEAILDVLRGAWEHEDELRRLREEKKILKQQCQRRVEDLRKENERLAASQRELKSTVECLQNANVSMQGKINGLILKTYRGEGGITYTVGDLLRDTDRRELRELERMMRQRPDDYRSRKDDAA